MAYHLKLTCSKCKQTKPAENFPKDRTKSTGYYSSCKSCRNKTNNTRTRVLETTTVTFNGEEVPAKVCTKCNQTKNIFEFSPNQSGTLKRSSRCKACWRTINNSINHQYQRNWRELNKDKVKEAWLKRKGLRKALGRNIKPSYIKFIKNHFDDRCSLSGVAKNVEIDHFIPLSWGRGGTIKGNLIPMERVLNSSKGERNPFDWIKEQPFEIQAKFDTVVTFLAEQSEKSVKEFKEYVYWCEKNKRTLSELM